MFIDRQSKCALDPYWRRGENDGGCERMCEGVGWGLDKGIVGSIWHSNDCKVETKLSI